jgi:hypothetical protein
VPEAAPGRRVPSRSRRGGGAGACSGRAGPSPAGAWAALTSWGADSAHSCAGVEAGAPAVPAGTAPSDGSAAGRSPIGSDWIRGSIFWISVRGRSGRSGFAGARRTGCGGGVPRRRAVPAASVTAGASRRMTSRGWGSFLPCRMAEMMSVSMWASSPSTRTPMDFSLKTRSWLEIPIIRARSWTRTFPIFLTCSCRNLPPPQPFGDTVKSHLMSGDPAPTYSTFSSGFATESSD